MIPRDYITEWRAEAPWTDDAMVEQDLVISRALVEIYGEPELRSRLAFRGGTAIYKLYLRPAPRYSEDIDLVQMRAEPIGETLDGLRAVLDGWLGEPKRSYNEGRVLLVYRFESEESPSRRLRLKVEINTREHFTTHGLIEVPFEVRGRWFEGSAAVTSYPLGELLATKLRALYQRKKRRDLFDLWHAARHEEIDLDQLVASTMRYIEEGGHQLTRAQLEQNLLGKKNDAGFRSDLAPLLRVGVEWNVDEAMDWVLREVAPRLPGEPWKGMG